MGIGQLLRQSLASDLDGDMVRLRAKTLGRGSGKGPDVGQGEARILRDGKPVGPEIEMAPKDVTPRSDPPN
ncbi:MAG: hypothetical protein JRI68_30160 [Deltaproteobacteria bacterium]|nr:hypothetical protein [Deltaproteobacteria bacterium]